MITAHLIINYYCNLVYGYRNKDNVPTGAQRTISRTPVGAGTCRDQDQHKLYLRQISTARCSTLIDHSRPTPTPPTQVHHRPCDCVHSGCQCWPGVLVVGTWLTWFSEPLRGGVEMYCTLFSWASCGYPPNAVSPSIMPTSLVGGERRCGGCRNTVLDSGSFGMRTQENTSWVLTYFAFSRPWWWVPGGDERWTSKARRKVNYLKQKINCITWELRASW